MNERKWVQASDPQSLLQFVVGKVSQRRGRLLAVACCREEGIACRAEAFQCALSAAERLAEGVDDPAGSEAASDAVMEEFDEALRVGDHKLLRPLFDAYICLQPDPLRILARPTPTLRERLRRVRQLVRDWFLFGRDLSGRRPLPKTWCPLIRDIFGNPFRPVAFDPAWRTPTAVALASQMYESREFGAMPILADALQDAGCDSEDVLSHCRGPGPHVRGCWVVDLVLGKE